MNKTFLLVNCVLLCSIILLSNNTIVNPVKLLEYVTRLCQYISKIQGQYKDVSGEDIQREQEYDFIVVGAGTAGSVVANRLSEEEGWKVLLLEAGSYESFITDIPILSAVIQLTDYNWGYSTEPQDNACWAMEGRRCKWPRGKSLGGTSTINHMIYARGSRLDYDSWAEHGNQGWSYDEVLPYFLKSENMQIPELKSSKYHSSGGYLNIELAPYRTPLAQSFLDAAEELGYFIGDYNGENQHAFSLIQATMHNGSRFSASKAFLKPIQHRTNLHMAVNSKVTKIVIDPETKQTVGVEFMKDGVVYSVNVRKEVILAAGAMNSPQILMLSGVGPRDHLLDLGIPVIKDLKVGNNLNDHVAFVGLTFMVNDTVGLNKARILSPVSLSEYVFSSNGPLTVPGGAEAIGYIRTKFAQDERPDVELIFIPSALNSDVYMMNVLALGFDMDFYDKFYKSIPTFDSWLVVLVLLQPKSSGSIKLRDEKHFHSPIFNPNYFDDREEVETIIEGIKVVLSLAETTPFKKYDTKIHRIPVPGCEELTFASDEYWACAIKYLSISCYHQSGTCKMGPATDPNAVVDPTLRVYGVKGLRVADASIIPTMPTAHTAAVAYMIGEKASDLIKESWR